jgi:hypothetical protein
LSKKDDVHVTDDIGLVLTGRRRCRGAAGVCGSAEELQFQQNRLNYCVNNTRFGVKKPIKVGMIQSFTRMKRRLRIGKVMNSKQAETRST